MLSLIKTLIQTIKQMAKKERQPLHFRSSCQLSGFVPKMSNSLILMRTVIFCKRSVTVTTVKVAMQSQPRYCGASRVLCRMLTLVSGVFLGRRGEPLLNNK